MKPLMTHIVAGYPNMQASREILEFMVGANVQAIEIQIPFSDPIADGPVLMRANDCAVKTGTQRQDVLELLCNVNFGKTDVYIMCYYQSLFYSDAATFISKAIAAGCKGFIIPDLPFDSPDMHKLLAELPVLRQSMVPVVSPGVSNVRLQLLKQVLEPKLVYVTARKGITGSDTQFGGELQELTYALRQLFPNSQLAIGFGIKNHQDVKHALRFGDRAVVGSALTAAYENSYQHFIMLMDRLV